MHRRIAVGMIRLVGGTDPNDSSGHHVSKWTSGGWISNTATTLMMLPVALALCHELPGPKSMRALLLGLAYSDRARWSTTPIGTPPNVVLMGIYEETTGNTIGFLDWMLLGG